MLKRVNCLGANAEEVTCLRDNAEKSQENY